MRVVIDTTKLNEIMRRMPGTSQQVVQKMAQDSQTEVVNNFSAQSPSPEGDPPGVDTSALKNSIVAEPRGEGWVLHDGVEYGVHLEYGTMSMGARPFFAPAIERMMNNLPSDLAEAVYIDGDVS